MRAETRKIMTAFLAGKSAISARSRTDGSNVYLHGNRIAWREPNGDICMTLAGWGTTTTRDRLNGLCELHMGKRPYSQRKGYQFFDDMPISVSQVIAVHNIIPATLDLAA